MVVKVKAVAVEPENCRSRTLEFFGSRGYSTLDVALSDAENRSGAIFIPQLTVL